jgi:MFS family permease
VTAGTRLVTPTLATCLGITAGAHIAVYLLNATLPLHVVALGGSKTQVGLLFSVSGMVSMVLRPLVGGWIDRYGFRPVMLPGALVLVATLLVLPLADTPVAFIALMGGIGLGNGLISTGAGVLAAQASPPARRGEALGIYYALFSACIIVGRLTLSRCSDRIGRARVIVPAIAATGLSYLVLAAQPRPATLVAGAVLLGAGVALFYPTLLALLVDRVPEGERGSAIGTLSGSFDLGNVVGSFLVGVTFERVSYAAGFRVAALGALLGLLLFLLAERRASGPSVLPRPVAGV